MKSILYVCFCLLSLNLALADIPEPPDGYNFEIPEVNSDSNEELTNDFNQIKEKVLKGQATNNELFDFCILATQLKRRDEIANIYFEVKRLSENEPYLGMYSRLRNNLAIFYLLLEKKKYDELKDFELDIDGMVEYYKPIIEKEFKAKKNKQGKQTDQKVKTITKYGLIKYYDYYRGTKQHKKADLLFILILKNLTEEELDAEFYYKYASVGYESGQVTDFDERLARLAVQLSLENEDVDVGILQNLVNILKHRSEAIIIEADEMLGMIERIKQEGRDKKAK